MTAPLLTAAQVADLLGLSTRAIYDLAAAPDGLPSFRFGTAVRFAPEDVESYKTRCRSFGTKRENASAINCTELLMDAESALINHFRARGLEPRPTHTTTPEPAKSSPKSRASNVVPLRLTQP